MRRATAGPGSIIAIGLGLTGCLSIPARGSGSGDAGSATSDGGVLDHDAGTDPNTGLRVVGCGDASQPPPGCTLYVKTDEFALGFAPHGSRMPTSLVFELGGGTHTPDVLAHATTDGQPGLNDGMGIAFTSASGSGTIGINDTLTDADMTASSVTVMARGPAYVLVEVSGTVTTCGGTTAFTSDFSVFPDGRIIRHDTIDIPTPACSTVTSYASFAVGAAPLATGTCTIDGGTVQRLALDSETSPGTDGYTVCLTQTENGVEAHVAFSQAEVDNELEDSRFHPVGTDQLSIQDDWILNGAQHTPGGSLTNSIAYQIGTTTSCAALVLNDVTLPELINHMVARPHFGVYEVAAMNGSDVSLATVSELPPGTTFQLTGVTTIPSLDDATVKAIGQVEAGSGTAELFVAPAIEPSNTLMIIP